MPLSEEERNIMILDWKIKGNIMNTNELYLVESEYWTNNSERLINQKLKICISREEAEREKARLEANYNELYSCDLEGYESNDYDIEIYEVPCDQFISMLLNHSSDNHQFKVA